MQWFARHPRLVFLLLLAADGFVIWSISKSEGYTSSEKAQWLQLSIMCLIFGPLCLRFPTILGGIEGPAGHGAWQNPTPGVLVTVIGWLFMSTPLVLRFLLSFRD